MRLGEIRGTRDEVRFRQRGLAIASVFGLLLGPVAWSQGIPHVPPPTTDVQVIYDDNRQPHIFAFDPDPERADEDVFWTLGYVQMLDFPVQTLTNIFFACGRHAEAWGSGGISRDLLIRHWELPQRADDLIEDDRVGVMTWLEAYVAGVNAGRQWWRDRPALVSTLAGSAASGGDAAFVDPLPPELATSALLGQSEAALTHLLSMEVTLTDVVASGLALSAGLYFGAGPGVGTNVLGSRTSAGGTVLLNDSHLNVDVPQLSLYFLQVRGGTYRVSGWTNPGFPCVFLGANESLAWGTSVGGTGAYPSALAGGPDVAPLNYGNTPHVTTTWEVTLLPYPDPSFAFTPLGETLQQVRELQPGPITLLVKGMQDPLSETLWWVPAEPGEPTERYPVLQSDYLSIAAPVPGEPIRFRQSAALSGVSAWEFKIAMGLQATVEDVETNVLPVAQYGFGGALNLIAADDQGGLLYQYLARVPDQGPGVSAAQWEQPGPLMLDGSVGAQRWEGIHPMTDLPHKRTSATDGVEQFVSCNVTPDVTDIGASPAATTYIVETQGQSTWRQRRATEIIGAGELGFAATEVLASDVRERWAEEFWPFAVEAAAVLAPPDANVGAFVAFVVGKLAGLGPAAFDDEVTSEIAPYTHLLRSRFQRELLEQGDCGVPGAGSPCLDTANKEFAFKPDAARPDPADFGTEAEWAPARTALQAALTYVGGLYASSELVNLSVVADIEESYTSSNAWFPTPWTDAGLLGATTTLRWGHVNHLAHTAHAFPPLPWVPGGHLPFAYLLLDTAWRPFAVPFRLSSEQPAAMLPMPGGSSSLFFSGLGDATGPWEDQRVYPEPVSGQSLYYRDHGLGSVVPFLVDLPPGGGLTLRYLAALGATGIVTDLNVALGTPGTTGALKVSAADRTLPTRDFATRTWRTFETDWLDLRPAGQHHHMIQMNVPWP